MDPATKYPEQGLIVYGGIRWDHCYYEYYKKVGIIISFDHQLEDYNRLVVRTDWSSDWMDSGQEAITWINSERKALAWNGDKPQAYTVLEGNFERVGWNDETLYIITDGNCYVFNIENYVVGTDTNDIKLTEYTVDEFKRLYPRYKLFDWYGH